MSVGGLKIWPSIAGRPDTDNPDLPVCNCGIRPGIAMGFWEPVRLADVSMKPWCFVNLGGLKLDPGFDIGFKTIAGPERGRRQGAEHQRLACPLVRLSADLLDGDRRRLPVPRDRLDRHPVHHRDRSAVAGQRAHRDHQPRSGAVRQPARARRLRCRLHRRDRQAADRSAVLVRRLPGDDVPAERQRRAPRSAMSRPRGSRSPASPTSSTASSSPGARWAPRACAANI